MSIQDPAHCVITNVNGTDPACTVHTHYAPCPHDGKPASAAYMHTDSDTPRPSVLAYWRRATDEQRSLIIHNGSFGDYRHHEVGESDDTCWCGPELLLARQHYSALAIEDVMFTFTGGPA